MAENPLLTLTRVLGGVILTQGRLGHQVLGQMLIMGSHEVAVAGAAVVVAGSSRQKNAVGQMALRTAAPALAVRLLLNKQERRLALERQNLDEERRKIDRLHAQRMRAADAIAPPVAEAPAAPAAADIPPVDSRLDEASAQNVVLRRQNRSLQRQLARLSAPKKVPKAPPAKSRKRKKKRR